jgi:hypothetical protein
LSLSRLECLVVGGSYSFLINWCIDFLVKPKPGEDGLFYKKSIN